MFLILKVKCLICIYQNIKNFDKRDLEEQNLKTVILLNPENEEAIFNLAKLKLETSDYKKSKELNDRLSDSQKIL